jgi:hypothetical protein
LSFGGGCGAVEVEKFVDTIPEFLVTKFTPECVIESVERLPAAKYSGFVRQVLVGVFSESLKLGAHSVWFFVQHAHQGIHQRVAARSKHVALVYGQFDRRAALRD